MRSCPRSSGKRVRVCPVRPAGDVLGHQSVSNQYGLGRSVGAKFFPASATKRRYTAGKPKQWRAQPVAAAASAMHTAKSSLLGASRVVASRVVVSVCGCALLRGQESEDLSLGWHNHTSGVTQLL